MQEQVTTPTHRRHTRGLFVGSLASLCFGSSLVVNKVGLAQSTLTPLEYSALSVIVAGVLGCGLIVPKRAAIWACSRRCWLMILLLGVTASGFAYALIFLGQSLTTAINAGFLLSLSGFFTIIFAALFLREVIEPRKYVFILTLFIGIYLLLVGTHVLQFNTGDVLIVIAAVLLGGTNVLSKLAMREMEGELVASLRLIVGAILLLGFLLVRSPHVLTAPHGLTGWFLVSGVLMWGFTVCLYRAIAIAGATMGTLVTISYPVVSTIGSILFLNEEVAMPYAVGGVLILWSLYKLVGR